MGFSKYSDLQDNMKCNELRQEFITLLNYLESKGENSSVIKALDALNELADRQWHTYELLMKILE